MKIPIRFVQSEHVPRIPDALDSWPYSQTEPQLDPRGYEPCARSAIHPELGEQGQKGKTWRAMPWGMPDFSSKPCISPRFDPCPVLDRLRTTCPGVYTLLQPSLSGVALTIMFRVCTLRVDKVIGEKFSFFVFIQRGRRQPCW